MRMTCEIWGKFLIAVCLYEGLKPFCENPKNNTQPIKINLKMEVKKRINDCVQFYIIRTWQKRVAKVRIFVITRG